MTCSFYGVYSTMKWPKLYVTISFVLDAKLEKASLAFGVLALVCSCWAHPLVLSILPAPPRKRVHAKWVYQGRTMEGITCSFSLIYYYFSEDKKIILQVRPETSKSLRPSPMSHSICVCGILCSTLLLFVFSYPGMGIRSQSIKT